MDNVHHAEMTYLIRREKELQRKLQKMRDDFGTWRERVELAEDAGRSELAEKARQRIQQLRFEGTQLRDELEEIADAKKKLRKESKMPTGEETRRAEALLRSFKESGLVDPDEAQLQEDIEQAAGADDAELEALKAKAGINDESAGEPETPEEPEESAQDDLDAELEALRRKMGAGDAGDGDDVDLDELEKMLSNDDE